MAALEDRYRRNREALLGRLSVSLTRLYGATIEPDELDGSFARLFPRVAPVIRSAQLAGVSLSTAYLSALILRDGGRTSRLPVRTDLIGTSRIGTLEEGMDAWPAIVKAQIGKGVERPEAIAFGLYLMHRFADGETTRVMDEQTEFVARESKQFRGWFGNLSPTACRACVAHNSGMHSMNEQPLRHGGCGCTQQYVVI